MLKKPPHVLVTTPESRFILLTAERSRQMLRTVSTIIVDEIHAMAAAGGDGTRKPELVPITQEDLIRSDSHVRSNGDHVLI
jgi:replicative superfamily II helicase